MDKYTLVIILTAIGFFALAAILLVPIWRFLNSEEKRAEEWDEEIRESATRETERQKTESGVDHHERRQGL